MITKTIGKTAIKPRPYQEEAIKACIDERQAGTTRGIVSLPTGTGKTPLAGMIISAFKQETIFLVHREELLHQAVEKIKLTAPGANVGILRAEEHGGLDADICVASVQTAARPGNIEKLARRAFCLAVVDECHHFIRSSSYWRILSALGFMDGSRDKFTLGLTATPFRLDRAALSEAFEKVIFERSILTMIKAGYLCDARGIAIRTETDISDIRTRAGDFAADELSMAIDTPERNGVVVDAYLSHADGRKAVVFTVDVKHAQNVAAAFLARGVNARAVHGKMKREERAAILDDYARGALDVVTNCGVLTEGWDVTETGAVLHARPTKSKGLYIQMTGRGLRLHPGKKDCIVLDFVDNAGRHNLCGFSDLGGEETINPENGESITEAIARAERSAADKVAAVHSEEIDLFGRSAFVWSKVNADTYRATVDADRYVWVRKSVKNKRRYMVYVADKRGAYMRTLADNALDLGYAQGIAEDYMRAEIGERKMALSAKSAAWRAEPPTEKQIVALRHMRVKFDAGAITRGGASDLIDAELARRQAVKERPASDAQIWRIRHVIGRDIPADISFSQARRIIAAHAAAVK